MRTNTCQYCRGQHSIQAFISHSNSDKALANLVRDYCCLADVYPLLFEMPQGTSLPASVQIISELNKSSIYFALLGPEVSKRTWTQVWMAFEAGVFSRTQNLQQRQAMFLIEDITQSNDAAIPFCQTAILLDFADAKSWSSIKTLLTLLNPTILLDRKLLRESNRLRLSNLIILDFQCPNPSCRSKYQIHVWVGQRAKRRSGIPLAPRSFSIKCSVCRDSANIQLMGSASGPPNWVAKSRRPRPYKLPLSHISRLV